MKKKTKTTTENPNKWNFIVYQNCRNHVRALHQDREEATPVSLFQSQDQAKLSPNIIILMKW